MLGWAREGEPGAGAPLNPSLVETGRPASRQRSSCLLACVLACRFGRAIAADVGMLACLHLHDCGCVELLIG